MIYYQIFGDGRFSATIGEGTFVGDRAALEVSGPGGVVAALFIVGAIAICVMSCVGELVQLFPVPNAIPTYIGAFVDDDLGWICGVAYWYCFTAIFVNLYYTAGLLTLDLGTDPFVRYLIFGISPIILMAVNALGVNLFGFIETLGGIVKIFATFFVGCAMYHLRSVKEGYGERPPLYDGVQANDGFVKNTGAAVFWAIPTLAYSFLGLESVAVTAFEARDIRSLRNPSRAIAPFILSLYAFTLIGELLIFSWTDPTLPQIYGSDEIHLPEMSSSGKMVIAAVVAENMQYVSLAKAIIALCIYSAISASNTALYIASRALYGLAYRVPARDYWLSKKMGKLGEVTDRTRVPIFALVFSTVFLCWLPFIAEAVGANGRALQIVFDILFLTAEVMCLIVWAALCLSLIRFIKWYDKCHESLQHDYKKFDRKRRTQLGYVSGVSASTDPSESAEAQKPIEYGARTGLVALQPFLAYVGLVGSLLIVFVFPTASWWNGTFSGQKLAIAYSAPVVCLLGWPLRRWWAKKKHGSAHRGWVHVSTDPNPLMETLDRLQCNIPERQERNLDDLFEQHPWLVIFERPLRFLRRIFYWRNERRGAHARQAVNGQAANGHAVQPAANGATVSRAATDSEIELRPTRSGVSSSRPLETMNSASSQGRPRGSPSETRAPRRPLPMSVRSSHSAVTSPTGSETARHPHPPLPPLSSPERMGRSDEDFDPRSRGRRDTNNSAW